LLTRSDAAYEEVVRPYLIGEDILQTPNHAPTRYVINFGMRSLEEAMDYPAALEIVRERVKPTRDKNRRKARREKWWLLGELVPAMRRALQPLDRFIATSAVARRFQFVWCEPHWSPSNRTIVFALDSDYHIGVLISDIHTRWAIKQGGTFEDRPHYTHTSAFNTFPWPQPTEAQCEAIASVSKKIVDLRQMSCIERAVGLTQLYKEVEQGAHVDLKRLHGELDQSVVKAYGWPISAAADEEDSNRRLLDLNAAIAANEVPYSPLS